MRLIIIGDGDAAAGLVDGLDLRAQLSDGPHERASAIDHMGSEVPHRAISVTFRPPGRWQLGIGIEILGMLAAKPGDVTDLAIFNQLSCELRSRCADIVETDHVDAAIGLGGGNHRLGIIKRGTERLFAKYRFFQGECGLGDRPMGRLRGRDDDGLDSGIGDQCLPVISRAFVAEFFGETLSGLWCRACDHLQTWTQRRLKNRADRGHRDRMRLAHIAAANNADADVSRQTLSPDLPTSLQMICNRLQFAYLRMAMLVNPNLTERDNF